MFCGRNRVGPMTSILTIIFNKLLAQTSDRMDTDRHFRAQGLLRNPEYGSGLITNTTVAKAKKFVQNYC